MDQINYNGIMNQISNKYEHDFEFLEPNSNLYMRC